MSVESPNTDSDLLDLLRTSGPKGVAEMAQAMGVTSTAIRQRITRLTGQGLIAREAVRRGRGRPRYLYQLTEMRDAAETSLAMTERARCA